MSLLNTTWLLNQSINVSSSLNVTVNFTSNNTNYTRFYIASSSLRYYRSSFSSVYAYRNSAWQNENYRIITFTGAGTTALENWLNANAIQIFNFTQSVEGNGTIIVNRESAYSNNLTLSAIAETGNEFVKYTINGVDYTTPEMTYAMEEDTEIVAYFEGIRYYKITATSNIKGLTIYQSDHEVRKDETVTLRARELPGYRFTGWSDGSTELERTIVVQSDILLAALYLKSTINESYYQYHGWIKDQLDMEAKPKEWVLVKDDRDLDDLLTKKTSTIEVFEMPENINEGDVIVLFTPKGVQYYQGVIDKIQDTNIQCSQMPSFFKGKFDRSAIQYLQQEYETEFVEDEICVLVQAYSTGQYYGSTYTDPIIATRLGGFTISSVGSQRVHLPKDLDSEGNDQHTQYDMEQFFYDMYEQYGVLPKFTVNYEGANYLEFETPSYTQPYTIGDNQHAIVDISPITTVESNNKLIIFNSDKTYRTTFVARKDGQIVQEPASEANRFELVNTVIVYSDDENDVLIKANLPDKMYNHKLTFTLYVDNNLYDWRELKLGMPLNIFVRGIYFDTVITGREIIHNENQNIKQIKYICGFVRTAITDILNTRFGKGR